MNFIIVIVLFISFCALGTQTLETPNYIVLIESRCDEGEVRCDKYTYVGTHKSSKNTIRLSSSSWHTVCADGITPCRFLGYKFVNGEYTYLVHQNGLLEVVKKQHGVLLSELGNWQ